MVTFRVSDVEPVTATPLPTVDTAQHLASLGWKTTEAHRMGASRVIKGPLVHPLALAVDTAFSQHRPLIFGPDAVWMCLAQSLATHIDLHAEELRPRLVRHQGQLDLDQRRDDFTLGDPNNDWPAAIEGLTAKIREHIGGRASLFIADFSTTGPLERTASQVALMGAMRQYFRYSVSSLCGIPEITLTGTPEDWASIRRRVAAFGEFDLGWWVSVLDPVLEKIEATARAGTVGGDQTNIDGEFWRRMYKMEHESGGDRAYGWLNTFFAYVGDPPERNEFPSVDAGAFEGHKLSDYPPGRTRVSFTWKIRQPDGADRQFPMELVAGLFGVVEAEEKQSQDQENQEKPFGAALGVTSGWVVGHAKEDSGFLRSPSDDDKWPTTLRPRHDTVLETLESLRHEPSDERYALHLSRNEKLRSIEGIQHLRGLVHLAISDAPLLESLAPLIGMASLTNLDLRSLPKLKDVRPVLESLPHLQTLAFMGTDHLPREDFLPIAKMTNLTCLTLFQCKALPEPLRKSHFGPDAIANALRMIRELVT